MGSILEVNHNKRTTLLESDLKLLLENTNFSLKEITDWHKNFMNVCPKGKLNRKRFTQIFKCMYPAGHVEDFCRYLFNTFDTTRKGSIDFVEFLVVVSLIVYGEPKEKLKLFFDVYDIDKNGKIELSELKEIVKAFYDLFGEENRKGENAPAKRVEKIMSQLDRDKDNLITRDEFVNGCLRDNALRKMLAPML